jgi:hypothetical protein
MVQDSLLSRVAPRFTEKEVAWILSLTSHPQVEAITEVARAKSVDLFTAAIDTTVLSTRRVGLLPVILSRSVLASLTAMKHLRAALFVHYGDFSSAERELMDVLSLGFHLRDGATSVFDQSLSQETIVAALAGLQDLYSLTGDPQRDAMGATLRSLDLPDTDLRGTDLSQALDRMSSFSDGGPRSKAGRIYQADAVGLPGVQWEALALASMVAECGDLQGITSRGWNQMWRVMNPLTTSVATTPSREVLLRLISNSILPERGSRELWRSLGIPLPVSHRAPLITEWFELTGWVMNNPKVPRCFAYRVIGEVYGALY